MAYPLSGSQGAVTSWGAAGVYAAMLAKISPNAATIDIDDPEIDVSSVNSVNSTFIAGLRSASGTIVARAFSTPRLGNVGVFDWASTNYETNIEGWTFTVQPIAVHDITSEPTVVSGAPTWRNFMPDTAIVVRGTVRAKVDNTSPLVAPTAPAASSVALTLTFGDSATDDAINIAGAFTTKLATGFRRGDPQFVDYEWVATGAVTVSGTNNDILFGTPTGATALTSPLWSQGGATTNTLLTLTAGPGRTYAVDAFYRQIRMSVAVGEPVSFEVDWQGTGAVTIT